MNTIPVCGVKTHFHGRGTEVSLILLASYGVQVDFQLVHILRLR
jgi:hypothetical protein